VYWILRTHIGRVHDHLRECRLSHSGRAVPLACEGLSRLQRTQIPTFRVMFVPPALILKLNAASPIKPDAGVKLAVCPSARRVTAPPVASENTSGVRPAPSGAGRRSPDSVVAAVPPCNHVAFERRNVTAIAAATRYVFPTRLEARSLSSRRTHRQFYSSIRFIGLAAFNFSISAGGTNMTRKVGICVSLEAAEAFARQRDGAAGMRKAAFP